MIPRAATLATIEGPFHRLEMDIAVGASAGFSEESI
jgi:hypothetical protein